MESENKNLVSRAPDAKGWEIFTILKYKKSLITKDNKVRYGAKFALKGYNDKYVMFDKENSKQLSASETKIGDWESFVLIQPSSQKGNNA